MVARFQKDHPMEGLHDARQLDFSVLANQYKPMINKILRSLHIYRNKDEFFQLSLVGLWEASLRFNPEKGEFTNYAYSSIKGLCMAEMTRRNRIEERNVYPEEEFWRTIEDSNLVQPFEKEYWLPFCEGLNENQRKWFLYTCYDGLSIREIASIENVSISTVKAWRKGAQVKLKQNLQTFG
jgi:DNA-directed RNA polymerase